MFDGNSKFHIVFEDSHSINEEDVAVVAEAATTPVMISEAGCAEQDDTPNEVLYHLALEKYSSYVYLWYNILPFNVHLQDTEAILKGHDEQASEKGLLVF